MKANFRKGLVTIGLLFFVLNLFAQYETGSIFVEVSNKYITQHGYANHPAFGVNAEVYISDYFSLQYRFSYGKNSVHSSSNLFGIPLLLLGLASRNGVHKVEYNRFDFSNWILWTVIAASVFENFAFHIRPTKHIDISPYASLLGITHIKSRNDIPQKTFFSGTLGLKLNLLVKKRWVFSCYGEGVRLYGSNGSWGTNAGINLGVKLK